MILIGMAVVAVGLAGFILRIAWLSGSFKTITPHFDGRCRLVDGPIGPEDVTVNQRTGVAYVSATDRRARGRGEPVGGGIWAYDLTRAESVPINLTPDADIYFQPHGISLWVEPDGRQVLFVVNHPAPGHGWPAHTIEIFDVQPNTLIHRATLTDPRLVTPNDIVAVGVDRFYVTNTHAHPPGRRQTIETYLQLRGAEVLGYGRGGFRTAIPDLVFPNGINASADGSTVYVAAVTWRSVLVYDRNPQTDALTLRTEIPLDTAPDNIEVAADGDLWVGCHPKLFDVPKHTENAANLSPSQVLRVTADGKTIEEVYLDEGDPISASSAAARYGNRLLIGQISGAGFLDCEMADAGNGVTGGQ
jgi:arylesterase/paraoxonase